MIQAKPGAAFAFEIVVIPPHFEPSGQAAKQHSYKKFELNDETTHVNVIRLSTLT